MIEEFLEAIHRRVDGGLDITTFGNSVDGTTGVEIQWRWDGTSMLSIAPTLSEVLRNVVGPPQRRQRLERRRVTRADALHQPGSSAAEAEGSAEA